MPTTTYTPIASITLSASASDIIFSNLPQTSRDLIVVIDGTTSVGINLSIYFNGDTTASNYPYVRMIGNGSVANSDTGNNIIADLQTVRSNNIIHIMDYSTSDKQKPLISRWGDASSVLGAIAMRWTNTSPITSLRLRDTNNAATFQSGTTVTIFGVIA